MKRIVETNDTLIPPAQIDIIKTSLSNFESVLHSVNTDKADAMRFDCRQLKAMMNYPVYVDIPKEDKDNFVHLYGVDFPQYVYEKKETFFLFGSYAVESYKKDDYLEFLYKLPSLEYETASYIDGSGNLSEFISSFIDFQWGGFTIIPKDVYVDIQNLH